MDIFLEYNRTGNGILFSIPQKIVYTEYIYRPTSFGKLPKRCSAYEQRVIFISSIQFTDPIGTVYFETGSTTGLYDRLSPGPVQNSPPLRFPTGRVFIPSVFML